MHILTMSLLPFLALNGVVVLYMQGYWNKCDISTLVPKNKTWKGVVSAYFQMNSNAVQLKYECNMDQSHLNEPKT